VITKGDQVKIPSETLFDFLQIFKQRNAMNKIVLGFGLSAVLVLPASGQEKEEERVANAGMVIKEIVDIPDDVPQDVIDKADCIVILPSVIKFAIGIGGCYGPRSDDLPHW